MISLINNFIFIHISNVKIFIICLRNIVIFKIILILGFAGPLTQLFWVMRWTHFYWVMRPDPTLLGPDEEPLLLGHASGPNTLVSKWGPSALGPEEDQGFVGPHEDQVPWVRRRTQVSWILRPYPPLLDHASGTNSLESVVRAQFSFVSRPCPTLLGRVSKPKSHGSGHRPNSLGSGPKSHGPISRVGHAFRPKSLGSCAIPISVESCVRTHF